MDDTTTRLAEELNARAPLTMDSSFEDFAETIRLCVAFEVLDCPGMAEHFIVQRAIETALDASTLTERFAGIVRDAVAAEVRRVLSAQRVAA